MTATRRAAAMLILILTTAHVCAAVPVPEIVPDYIGDGLELAVTPTPQHAEMADDMLAVGPLSIHMPPGDYGAPMTIRDQAEALLGGSKGSTPTRVFIGDEQRNPAVAAALARSAAVPVKNQGDEAYRLYIGEDPQQAGGGLIVLAGNTPMADFWALQTLRQLVAEKGGVRYVRRGMVSDWPTFPKRGNKRPRAWEHRFRANYAWTSVAAKPEFRDVFRVKGAAVRHFKSIDPATPVWMDEIKAWARKAFDGGIREFVLKYDDTGYGMAEATREKFGGNYFAAQQAFLTEMFAAITGFGPDVDVFFMPQPYWVNAHDIIEYGAGLKAAGGLPEGLGLSFCGQEVISTHIPLGCVERAQETLGFTGHKAQIYDNYPRGGDFWAYRGRDPHLSERVECVFPERGTPVTRITVYDYLWNPAAYDPARSLKLACRELAGRDPARYRALYDYVTTWNGLRDAASFLPVREARQLVLASTRTLRAKYDKLRPLLENGSELAQATGVADSFLRGENWGESAALELREKFAPTMAQWGYKEGTARRAVGAITVDGKLDEAAWNGAAPLDHFVGFKQTATEADPNAPLMPDANQSEVRILYDDAFLYVGASLHGSKPPKLPNWSSDRKPGERANLAWRVPCIELFIDPELDRDSCFQIALNLQGWYSETHFGGFGAAVGTGAWWESKLEFKAVPGEQVSVIEARIPLASLGAVPKPGDRWGFQVGRKLNGYTTWSYMYEFAGFRYPLHHGTLVFD